MSIVKVEDVHLSYPDGTKALEGIDLSVEKGEFVGVLGANGSGKTTLLKVLNGLLKPAQGDVYLGGENLKSIDRNKLFSRACTVFQDPDDQLFSPTVGEDIAFGPTNMGLSKEEVERRVCNSLAGVEMSQFEKKAIHNLSYGQKKRICLAGVLAMGPEVIFLDEPTAALDPMGASVIMHLLKRLNKEERGVTMVMATHSVDLVPLFLDRVVILSKGKIVTEGLPQRVFSDPQMIRLAKLRLPKIGHLFEILKKKDKFDVGRLPLTIGEARREIAKLVSLATPQAAVGVSEPASEATGASEPASEAALLSGFTTGTCAQAAAKGAAIMLVTQKLLKKVEVETPSGIRLMLELVDQQIGRDFAICAVVKDAGDDPDVTDGVKIYAEVKFSHKRGLTIRGGEGVGRVTKPGLAVPVGEYAINPIPRQMIVKELALYLPKDKLPKTSGPLGAKGLEVTLSAPQGEELAKHTFNPRLGIVGGISIIGTTGIVWPKSLDAYKASLSLQLDVLKASGYKRAVLVLGYVGERFCKNVLKLDEGSIIKIGDYVGFMLRECKSKKIKEVLLAGHIGKLVKVANGQFNTHSKFGDSRVETIARYAINYGAKRKVIEEISKQTTAEATVDILRRYGLTGVFGKLAEKVAIRLSEFVGRQLRISCVLLSLKGEILAAHPTGKCLYE